MNLKFFILFIFCAFVSYSQESITTRARDSIEFYLNNSDIESKAYNPKTKLVYALRSKELSQIYNADSLLIKSYINLAALYSDSGKAFEHNSILFKKYSHHALNLAKRINNPSLMALANKTLGYYYFDKSVDSAYYYDSRAEKLYRNLNDKFNTAVVLLDIASLQFSDKDYTGSELTCVSGLSLLDQLENSDEVIKYRAYIYNLLGMNFRRLQHYETSIDYHKKAIKLLTDLYGYDSLELIGDKNNLGFAYRDSGQYTLAMEYFNEILTTKNLISKAPSSYVLALDNYAYTFFLLKDYSQLPKLYFDALHICDSLGFIYNSIPIKKHLSEYYKAINKKDSALFYAYEYKSVSEKYYKDDLLNALRMLSKLEEDSIATKHYEAYVKLSDSLLKNERAIRNKFGRIQYETDQIEQENFKIARERMWLLITSIVLIISSFLIYVIINQRNKNKELKFIQQQQEANEEIYNLMLSQNEHVEEARVLEKKRISQELHDGVLGRLFGTRLSLDSLNMGTTTDAINTRSKYIEELKTIEQDIRKVSHELNTDFISGAGFIDIINGMVETQTAVYKLKYKIDYDGSINWDNVSNKNKIHVYRIIQESLHNIHKHANATTVKISFKLKNNVICLSLTDNGCGFDVNKTKSGIGLKNINSRIKEINGTLEIISEIEKGTTIKINFPI